MNKKLYGFLTIALVTLFSGVFSSCYANQQNVLKTKSFQWVRGQLWVNGAQSSQVSSGDVIVKAEMPVDDSQTTVAKSERVPEELSKALDRAIRQ